MGILSKLVLKIFTFKHLSVYVFTYMYADMCLKGKG